VARPVISGTFCWAFASQSVDAIDSMAFNDFSSGLTQMTIGNCAMPLVGDR
jgi:hypothetical protein